MSATEMMTNPETSNDHGLLRLTRAGEEAAFLTLYRRHQGPIYRFVLQMSGSESLADDITQEVFMLLIRDTLPFDASRGSLSAYLYGIARNQVKRHLERGKLLVPLDEDSDEEPTLLEPLIAPDDPLGDLTRNEGLAALRQAILVLPLHYREVVALCDLEEMSYANAAQVLGCAVGTVRSRLHRAHALLVEKLRDVDEKSAARPRVTRCFA